MAYQQDSNYRYHIQGGSLAADDPTYVRRQADADILQALRDSNFCYIFNSRQMGKSSLRVRAMQQLQNEGILCLEIDLSSLGSQIEQSQWYKGIIYRLASNLNISETINWRQWWQEREFLSPVQCLSEFIAEILLQQTSQNIVIFIDEIDSILSFPFPTDDFFALIRSCYNQRVDRPEYQRLSFCLLGVATPSSLIQDKQRTPFNIGMAIDLTGLQLQEADTVLIQGLANKTDKPQAILTEILTQTGGQPFLTQKLCQLVAEKAENKTINLNKLIEENIVENWEAQDEPEHLRTIRNRILKDEQTAARLLSLYQQILEKQSLEIDNSPEQMELRLSGLVVAEKGRLRVYNPIYEKIFNLAWVERELNNLRPYGEAISAWLKSEKQDDSRLLQGEALIEALQWKISKKLSVSDDDFLMASQEKELETEKKKNQILLEAEKKARRRIKFGSGILIVSLLLSGLVGKLAFDASRNLTRTQQDLTKAQNILDLQEQAKELLQGQEKIKLGNLDYLLTLVNKIGNSRNINLSKLGSDNQILNNLWLKNQLDAGSSIDRLHVSPDGKKIAAVNLERGTVKIWQMDGKLVTDINDGRNLVNVSFSSNWDKIVTTNDSDAGKKKHIVWNDRGKQIDTIPINYQPLYGSKYNSDDRLLVLLDPWEKDILSKDIFNPKYKSVIKFQRYDGTTNDTIDLQSIDLSQLDVRSFSFSFDGKIFGITSSIARNNNKQDKPQDTCYLYSFCLRIFDITGKKIVDLKDNSLDNLKSMYERSGDANFGTGINITFSFDNKLVAGWGNGESYNNSDKYIFIRGNRFNLWKIDGTQIAGINFEDEVKDVSFSLDNKAVAIAVKNKIKLLLLDDQYEPFQLQPYKIVDLESNSKINSLSFTPDGKQIITAHEDGKVNIWELNKKFLDRELQGIDLSSYSVGNTKSFSEVYNTRSDNFDLADFVELNKSNFINNYPEVLLSEIQRNAFRVATELMSMSDDRQTIAFITDASETQKIQQNISFKLPLLHHHFTLAYFPAYKSFWQPPKRKITIVDRQDLKNIQKVTFPEEGLFISIKISPNGQYFASTETYDHAVKSEVPNVKIKLWDRNGKIIKTIENSLQKPANSNSDYDRAIAFSSDSQKLLVCYKDLEQNKITLLLSNVRGDELLRKDFPNLQKQYDKYSPMCGFNPDGQIIVTNFYNSIKLWNLNGTYIGTVNHGRGIIKNNSENSTDIDSYRVVFSPNNKIIATIGQDKESYLDKVNLWTLDGKLIASLNHGNSILNFSFDRDSKTIATIDGDPLMPDEDSTVKLWKVDGTLINTFTVNGSIKYPYFSQDRQNLAAIDLEYGTKTLLSLNYSTLLDRSCNWLQDYFVSNPNSQKEARKICLERKTKK